MKTTKNWKFLTTVQSHIWRLGDKIEEHRRKRSAKKDGDVIYNLERLHRLRERGAITEADYEELKEKLKNKI